MNKDGPRLVLFDQTVKTRVGVIVKKKVGPGLLLSDENGKGVWSQP